MKRVIRTISRKFQNASKNVLAGLLLLAGLNVFSQELTQEFISAGYTLTDLGSINLLPAQYGGLTIRPEDPNTLYICGNANDAPGALYTVALVRDPGTQHITGFASDAILYCAAPDNDGGLFFAPNGTLLFTRYSMNELGQINTANTYISTPLTQYGIASSVGSVALVPAGYPGAGNMIFASYNGHYLYNVPYTINASGFYEFGNKTAEVYVFPLTSGPEGIAYIPNGSAGFPNPSMVISSYGNGTVVVYEVGSDGLPVIETGREMVVGLSGAEGALIDPVTGDFLFSTFGGGNKVVRISGFVAPSAIGETASENNITVTAYPNPTYGPVTIQASDPHSRGTLQVFNSLGDKINEQPFAIDNTVQADFSSLPAGMYLLRIVHGNKVGETRLIKH